MLGEFRMAASEGRVGGHQRNKLWPKQLCGGRGAETVIIPLTTEAITYGRRRLVGCSPWGREESDMTERLHFHFFTFMHWRRKWQPTPVFLPGESQGQGSLVGCHLWDHTESDTTEAT